jgi:hypothetical protein
MSPFPRGHHGSVTEHNHGTQASGSHGGRSEARVLSRAYGGNVPSGRHEASDNKVGVESRREWRKQIVNTPEQVITETRWGAAYRQVAVTSVRLGMGILAVGLVIGGLIFGASLGYEPETALRTAEYKWTMIPLGAIGGTAGFLIAIVSVFFIEVQVTLFLACRKYLRQ